MQPYRDIPASSREKKHHSGLQSHTPTLACTETHPDTHPATDTDLSLTFPLIFNCLFRAPFPFQSVYHSSDIAWICRPCALELVDSLLTRSPINHQSISLLTNFLDNPSTPLRDPSLSLSRLGLCALNRSPPGSIDPDSRSN